MIIQMMDEAAAEVMEGTMSLQEALQVLQRKVNEEYARKQR
jgi:hypothetical protein